MSVKVSILVPVYNVERYIYKCIDSILSQTFTDFECIIVNDCSTDNCSEICNEYAKKDKRIKIIHKPQNEGLPQARKTGFENSSGAYILFIDSDDWMEPEMIKKLYSAGIESNADIIICDSYIDFPNGSYKYGIPTFDSENHFNNFGFDNSPVLWNKFFKREIIELITFPKASRYQDRVISQQAYFYAKKIEKVPCPLYHYNWQQDSMCRGKFNKKKYLEYTENLLLIINFFRVNLKDKFILIEEKINDKINKQKLKILKNKELRQEKSLSNFYPGSKFYRWLFLRLITKMFIFIIPHGLFIRLCGKGLFLKYFKREVSAVSKKVGSYFSNSVDAADDEDEK